MPKASESKAELEKAKLRAEIAQIKAQTKKDAAEAEASQILLEKYRRDVEKTAASDERNFVYRFVDSVRESSVQKCVSTLESWSRRAPGQDFTIVMDSPGGSVIDGFHLVDTLEDLKAKGHSITIDVRGMAASMGGIILQAADRRVMSKRAFILIHEISSLAHGSASDIEDELKFIKRLQEKSLDLLASRSSMSSAQIARKWKRRDWWLDADESLKLGFVDEVRGA